MSRVKKSPLLEATDRALFCIRRQDPYESLDPRFTVREIVAEPLRAHGRWRSSGEERVRGLLADVGLAGAPLDSHPGEYSGGQRQRIGIARALALDPQLVICDEIVVMYAGAVMERGPSEAVTARPRHPYTRALLDAIPASNPGARHLAKRKRTVAGIASAALTGCPFSTRCPKVQELCRAQRPLLEGAPQAVACHLPEA